MSDLLKNELKKKNDIELYISFTNGDDEAFNEIMQRYRKMIISFIIRYVGDLDVAEDLAQDTFVYILMHRNEYNPKITSLKSYLFLIAKCRAINYFRKKKNVNYVSEDYIANLQDKFDLDNELLRKDSKKDVYSVLKKLKKEYRMVIYLRDIQEFQYKEISEILNITLPQTKILIHRARKKIGKILREEGKIC